jgi:hypothetical protein
MNNYKICGDPIKRTISFILNMIMLIIFLGAGILILMIILSGFSMAELTYLYSAITLEPTTINSPDAYTTSIIKTTLDNTDQNIVKHIRSINVVGSIYEIPDKRNDHEIGVAQITGNRPFIKTSLLDFPFFSANIYVVSMRNYGITGNYYTCDSFELTLNHEIGHVVGYYNNGDTSESYAENYAYQHTINKGPC